MGRSKRAQEPAGPRFRGDEPISDLLDRDPRVEGVLASFGLPCQKCVVKDYETLTEGCAPLGLDVGTVLAKLNSLE